MIYTVTFNPAIDYVVRLDAPLEVGEVNRAKGEDCVLGGKGINVSGVLAQLGCESVALGFVAGETGAWLERGLAAQGLKTDFVHLENGMTRINVKIKAGQETELNGAGPDIPDEALHQLEEKLDGLTENDVLILAGSIPASLPQDVYERLLARLDGQGVLPCRCSCAEGGACRSMWRGAAATTYMSTEYILRRRIWGCALRRNSSRAVRGLLWPLQLSRSEVCVRALRRRPSRLRATVSIIRRGAFSRDADAAGACGARPSRSS